MNTPGVNTTSGGNTNTKATLTPLPALLWTDLEPWMDTEYVRQVCALMRWEAGVVVPVPAPSSSSYNTAANGGRGGGGKGLFGALPDSKSGSIPPSGLFAIYIVVGLIRVLNSISGVLVVPVVGTILAQAAVVFAQRRRPKQDLNLVQLFALADRGWALMTMITTVQQLIQSALVSFELITVMSCLDLPQVGRCSIEFPVVAAYDAEPGAIRNGIERIQ
ncbi:hypothetical protein B0H14DRAFT_3452418 [Mycena olivaceomarginata]|nr:hypothetical protein B0H14DRAFT_3452418 [Mycena olivaceomarginata]